MCPTQHHGPLTLRVFADKRTTCAQTEAMAGWTRSHEHVLPFRVAGQRWRETYANRRGTEQAYRVVGKPNDGAGWGVLLFFNRPVS